MRFFRYLFVAIGTVAVLVAVLIAVVWVGIVAYSASKAPTRHDNVPTRNERIEAERIEKLRTKAEEWKVFCAQYDCSDIPAGYIVKNIGQDTLNLIHTGQPFAGDTCRLATDSFDETEYVDGKVVRGAALDHIANPYFVQCPGPSKPFTRWESHIRFYRGQFRAEEPGRNNVYLAVLGPARFWEADPKPTYASRRALLRPASEDFDLFHHDSFKNLSRVYLSRTRMFQGRYVVLICSDRCEMQTISFAEDKDLNSLHFTQLIQFTWYDWDCEVFTQLWKCGPPVEEHLDSMANYIRFLDQAVDAARRQPLAILQ